MYKVVYKFADLEDGKHIYNVGDEYPRKGAKASQKRLESLSGDKNQIGRPVIEYDKETALKEFEEVMPKPETKKPKKAKK
jgi:hypothetical protein